MKRRLSESFRTLMCWLYAAAYPVHRVDAVLSGERSPAGRVVPLWRQASVWRWVAFALVVMPEAASASSFFSSGGGTLPWMQPLGAIASSLDGPVARVGVLIAIAFFGLLMMFGELKGIFGTAARILFGASLALGAVQWAGVLNFGSGRSTSSFINNGAP